MSVTPERDSQGSRTPALYALLLRSLPRTLREDYGEEITFVFLQRLKETPELFGRGMVWGRAAMDLLHHGMAARWRERFGRGPSMHQNQPGSRTQSGKEGNGPSMFGDQLRQDIVYSFRTIRRSPVYTAVVVITLGVGIALNTLVFSVMNPFLLRPLPYEGAEDLVHLGGVDPIQGWDGGRFSNLQMADLKQRSRAFEDLAGYYYGTGNLSGGQAAEQASTTWVTGNLFPLLGVRAAMGRVLGPEDDLPGAPEVTVLSHGLWVRRYGADPEIVGKTVRISGVGHTVVGVLPVDFNFPFNAVQLWLPMRADLAVEARGDMGTLVIGRLAEGWTADAAREEISEVQRNLAAA